MSIIEFRQLIFNAVRDGNLRRLKVYLDNRPSCEIDELVHSYNNDGATPLVMASRDGHTSIVSYLIDECGADICQSGSVTFDGETIEGAPPLWCAAAAGHLSIVTLLVERGADVNGTTRTNSTPLRAACFDGHTDIVQYLVEHGADMEVANRHGHTCLMIACYKGHLRIAKYLVAIGADVNRKSVKGNTALHDCAESGSLDIMKLLLKNHAKMEVDSYGMTPLLAASVTGHIHIVEHLICRPQLVSRSDKIDALELLGATFVDKKRDLVGSYKLWKRALEERNKEGLTQVPKNCVKSPISAYENTVEVENHTQLEAIVCEPDEMRMQALLVRERILGPAHPDTSYYIRYRGAVYADMGQFDRCITLWMYALDMQQKILEPLSPMTQSSLLSFAELFSFMLSEFEGRREARRQEGHGGEGGAFSSDTSPIKLKDIISVFDKAIHEVKNGHRYIRKLVRHLHHVSCVVGATTTLGGASSSASYFNNQVKSIRRRYHNHHQRSNSNNQGVKSTSCAPNNSVSLNNSASSSSSSTSPLRFRPNRSSTSESSSNVSARCSSPAALSNNNSTLDRDMNFFNRTLVILLHLVCLLTRLISYLEESRRHRVTEEEEQLLRVKRTLHRFLSLDLRGRNRCSLLHLACSREASSVGRYPVCQFPSLEAIRLLLECGGDANGRDEYGNTPLHIVAHSAVINEQSVRTDIVKLLLEKGDAHIDTVNEDNLTFFDILNGGGGEESNQGDELRSRKKRVVYQNQQNRLRFIRQKQKLLQRSSPASSPPLSSSSSSPPTTAQHHNSLMRSRTDEDRGHQLIQDSNSNVLCRLSSLQQQSKATELFNSNESTNFTTSLISNFVEEEDDIVSSLIGIVDKPLQHLSLKCLAARAIKRHFFYFDDESSDLLDVGDFAMRFALGSASTTSGKRRPSCVLNRVHLPVDLRHFVEMH